MLTMKKINVIELAHQKLKQILHKDMVVVDATCGNGNDTHFLSPLVKQVHAFDIQSEAIINSKDLNKDFSNITYYHTSHERITEFIKDYGGIIFNLGYLPKGNKLITTTHQTTITTLKRLHKAQKGFILIVAYPGHIEGFIEQVAIQSFLDKLDIIYEVIRLPHITKNEAPIIYFYQYINQSTSV